MRNRKKIQLVLTDVVMPGGSGPVLAEHLDSESDAPKFLYMSGYTENEIVENGMVRAGINFIQKPFTTVELAWKVHAALHKMEPAGP